MKKFGLWDSYVLFSDFCIMVYNSGLLKMAFGDQLVYKFNGQVVIILAWL